MQKSIAVKLSYFFFSSFFYGFLGLIIMATSCLGQPRALTSGGHTSCVNKQRMIHGSKVQEAFGGTLLRTM